VTFRETTRDRDPSLRQPQGPFGPGGDPPSPPLRGSGPTPPFPPLPPLPNPQVAAPSVRSPIPQQRTSRPVPVALFSPLSSQLSISSGFLSSLFCSAGCISLLLMVCACSFRRRSFALKNTTVVYIQFPPESPKIPSTPPRPPPRTCSCYMHISHMSVLLCQECVHKRQVIHTHTQQTTGPCTPQPQGLHYSL
jgi:hypothetical protein